MNRPAANECHEYYRAYTDLVPEGDVLAMLAEGPDALDRLLEPIDPDRERFTYASGKWTIREVVGHVLDTERVFASRALHIARGDPAPLPGMEQDDWVRGSNAGERQLADQLAEFRAVRSGNVRLFASFDEATLLRRGVASEAEFTVRAIVHILAGHERHHRQVLEERYLSARAR